MKHFIRTKEDFVCEHCGSMVQGNGYTNHCPHCLWSKHVDINPGDRAETCGGAMEPMRLTIKSDSQVITHRCTRCGFERNNRVSPNDNNRLLLILSTRTN